MSDSQAHAPAVDHKGEEGDSEVEALRHEVAELRGMVYDQQRTIEQQQERIEEIKEDNEPGAVVKWDDDVGNASNIMVTHPETGVDFPLGAAVGNKLPKNPYKESIDELEELVYDLARGKVDPTDLVAAGGTDYELPIEETIAKIQNEVAEDPSANKQRAAVVFRAFGGRARQVSGKMILESGDVKNILEDPEKCGISDPNPNTVGRTMKQCAKLTSEKAKKEREHTAPENLITMEKRNGRRVLVADHDEWTDYLARLEERRK